MGTYRGAFLLFVINVIALLEPRVIIDESQAHLGLPVAVGALPRAIPCTREVVAVAGLGRTAKGVTVLVAYPTQIGAHLNLAAQKRERIIGLAVPKVVAVLGVGGIESLVTLGWSKSDGAHIIR